MVRSLQHIFAPLKATLDLLCLGCAWRLSSSGDNALPWTSFLVLATGWMAFLWLLDGYGSLRARRVSQLPGIPLSAGLLSTVCGGAAAHYFGLYLPVEQTGAFFALAGLLLVGQRVVLRSLSRRGRLPGQEARQVLIAGAGPRAESIRRSYDRELAWGFHVVGHLAEAEGNRHANPILGTTDELEQILDGRVVDEVALALETTDPARAERLINCCREVGVDVRIHHEWLDLEQGRVRLEHLGRLPVVTLAETPAFRARLVVKRLMDILLASTGLVLALPLGVMTACAVRFDSQGPILFSQERVGLRGRRFMCLKFRSMVENAEELKDELLPRNDLRGPAFKMADDPRITPVGRFLRRSSLDELPQLINVIRGEMSIVGPRPPLPSEVEGYERWQRRRLSVKPGLTCLWQVGGRSDLPFEEWMRLDLEYVDRWSLLLDLRIIARTVPAVLSGRGAR